MFKKIAEKSATLMSAHPRLFSIAVGFAITLAIGTAIGMFDHGSHMASAVKPVEG